MTGLKGFRVYIALIGVLSMDPKRNFEMLFICDMAAYSWTNSISTPVLSRIKHIFCIPIWNGSMAISAP